MNRLLQKLERKPGSHKGQNGRLGIIAGSVDFAGAPAITGKAALRSGCDLAKILTSQDVSATVSSYSEDLIVSSYRGKYFGKTAVKGARELSGWSDSIVIGPGMGDLKDSALKRFLENVEVPVVVDADAIEPAIEVASQNMVFTPHRSEAERIEDEYGSLPDFAEQTGATVLLKGPVDRVYASERYENKTGSPAMTSGGTGDALAGIVGSLLAQGLGRTDASRLAAWINGKAGERAAEQYGNGMLATDLVEIIPEVMW